jgi:hypothetical protein
VFPKKSITACQTEPCNSVDALLSLKSIYEVLIITSQTTSFNTPEDENMNFQQSRILKLHIRKIVLMHPVAIFRVFVK